MLNIIQVTFVFKGLNYMCWPSKQNMVCIQESFNCSVAVLIGECVVMHILYVKIILSLFIFF
jgi:hypothetical protein